MANERGDVKFVHAGMYCPVTDAAMDTASYDEFAEGYYLTRKAMEWFWDAYTTDPAERAEIYASPNQATTDRRAQRCRRPCSTRAVHGVRDGQRTAGHGPAPVSVRKVAQGLIEALGV
jgi:acetyl esterase/lipase